MKYIHPKGAHGSEPFTPKIWIRKVSGIFHFTPEAKYNLNSIEQGDWNKMCGIGFNPLKPNQNAAMIAWRYNTNKQLFEVSPYFNVNSNIVRFDNQPSKIIQLYPFERVEFTIDYWGVNFKSTDLKFWIQTPYPTNLKSNYWTSFRIQPWFGGNKPAPNDIFLHLTF